MVAADTHADSEYPEFGATYAFDERRHPSQVTIVSENDDEIATAWITAPIEIALPVEECR